jgi:HlyD family secretion protein
VLRIPQTSEGTVPAGTGLLDVGDPARMEVIADLLTTDAVQAQPGRIAVVERWGGPPVHARVRLVEPAAFTKVSALGIEEQRVKVVVDLDDPPEGWRAMGDGYRVTLRILTQRVDQAVLAPVGALFPIGDGGMGVFRVEDGRARLQPVELGGRNGSEAWVRSGLAPGQNVIIYPPPNVDDGQRVQPRR